MTDTRDEAACYLIQKRGLYYRPNAKGYTGIKDEAGRYTEAEARSRAYPNGPHGPRDGMEYMHEEDAPDYSPSCWPETKTAHGEKRIAALEEQVARLKAENADARDRALVEAYDALTKSQSYLDACATILALRSRPSPAQSEAVRERVARAIYLSRYERDGGRWESVADNHKEDPWRVMADAAIAALASEGERDG